MFLCSSVGPSTDQDPRLPAKPSTYRANSYAGVVRSVLYLATELFVVVAPDDASAFHDQVLALCRRAGFIPRVASRVPDVQAAIALVAAGLGISPVPAAAQGFKRKGVVYRPLRPYPFRMEMGLAWRRDDDSVLVQHFRRVARETARRTQR